MLMKLLLLLYIRDKELTLLRDCNILIMKRTDRQTLREIGEEQTGKTERGNIDKDREWCREKDCERASVRWIHRD